MRFNAHQQLIESVPIKSKRSKETMNIVELAYAKNRDFHSAEFRDRGPKTEALWKGGVKSQHDRFAQIIRLLSDLSGKSVLDVGCGFGDFSSYMDQLGYQEVDYCGIDICADMIRECRRRHPDKDFQECGILEFAEAAPRFDYAVASGIFAMPTPDWESYVEKSVRSMFSVVSIGVVVNFLSSFSQAPSEASHYANPGQTLDLLMRHVSPWAVLSHNYRWNDFTIGLFREPRNLDDSQRDSEHKRLSHCNAT